MDELLLQGLEVPFTTPDLVKLEQQTKHLVFDPRVRKSPEILCSAYTEEKMSLFIRTRDELPIPIRLRGVHRARIGGALYKTSVEGLVNLDKAYQNRLLFERKRIKVYVPYMDEKKHREIQILEVPVWMYSGIPDLWEDEVQRNQRKYNIAPQNPSVRLAKTYIDNESILNNHFRCTEHKFEDFIEKPQPVLATEAVVQYVKKKNEDAVALASIVYNEALRIVEEEETLQWETLLKEAIEENKRINRNAILEKAKFWRRKKTPIAA